MNSELKLTMQLTMIDMLSAVAKLAKTHILGLGEAGKQVQKDFDLMTQHVTRGLKAVAAASYVVGKLKPGVAAAADMQEELHKVEMNLANSTLNAAALHKQLQAIKDTANFVGQNSPFTSQQIVGVEAQLLKSGIDINQVTGERGVTWNAAGLAALSGMDPAETGANLAKIGQTFGFTKEEQYSEIANWLEKAESSAGHDLGQLFYGMKMSGNSAKALGISPKDLVSMLTMAAPLGDMAGTSINRFIDRLAGGHREERKYLKYLGLNFFDAKTGKFKGTENLMEEVRTKFGAISNDKNKLILYEKIFGEEGSRFAKIVTQSKETFHEWVAFYASHKDISEKQEIWSQGFNASWTKLVTTIKSTGASLFDPLLKPLTETNDFVNNITGKLGAFAEGHKDFAKVVSYGMGGAAAGLGLYALYNLVMGVSAGGKVLAGLRGIAAGKVMQEVAGVQPVFVTNLPPGIPIAGGLVPTSVMLAPALLAAIVGALAIAFGKSKTDTEVGEASTERLQALRKQHMVLGGGPGTYQVQAIDRELARRGIKPEGPGSMSSGPLSHYWASHNVAGSDAMERRRLTEDILGPSGIKNNINVVIQVDGQGRITSASDSLNTTVNTVKRGHFFGHMATSH